MDTLLAGISGTICYLDDILVYGVTFEDHKKNLDLVFKTLKEAGLRLNKAKCIFGKKYVKYLGHMIDENGLHPLEDKVLAIKNAPAPKTVSELQSCIGLVCYNVIFLSTMAPLPISCCNEQDIAFKECKKLLNADSVLVHYDPKQELVVACDA